MSNPWETLEGRVLLSASLQAGTLRIFGTAGDDQINLSHPLIAANQIDPSRTLVVVNGQQYFFKTSRIRVIKINALQGDDTIKVGAAPPLACRPGCAMPERIDFTVFSEAIPTLLVGGSGADSIIGGFGRDRIFGGDGNDTMFGGLGKDLLDGGEGDDLLDGGADNDVLIGAAGNDSLDGLAGDDQLFGGDDDDTLRANSAKDLLSGGDGQDLLKYPVYFQTIDGSVIAPAFKVPADIESQESFRYVAVRRR